MSNTVHTAGPWTATPVGRDFRIERADTEDGPIAQVYGTGDDIGAADARLIAAAPELLEALQRRLTQHLNRDGSICECELCKSDRALCARATGETP